MSPLKGMLERTLVGVGVPSACRRLTRDRALVLSYHNVVPDHEGAGGDPSLHLPVSDFRAQLRHLRRHYDVVSLEDLFDGSDPTSSAGRIALTFDDAYRGTLEVAADLLAETGLPATIFVPPSLLGSASGGWDAGAGASGGLDDDVRRRLLVDLEGDADRIEEWARSRGRWRVPDDPHRQPVTASELVDADRTTHLTFGIHGWSHRNLSVSRPEEVEEEVRRSLDWLRDRVNRVSPWLALPYGAAGPTVRDAAARVGLRGVLELGGSWFDPGQVDRFRVPRLNIPAGVSLPGFQLRVAGAQPPWRGTSG